MRKLFSALAGIAGTALFVWAVAAAQPPRQNGQPPAGKMRKPSMTDTIRANIYAICKTLMHHERIVFCFFQCLKHDVMAKLVTDDVGIKCEIL